MSELVDRDEERQRLIEAARNAPQLVVVRGRRRVGKSFLIDRALAGHRVVSFQADEQPEHGHMGGLAQEAARLLPGNPPLIFADWDAALTFFAGQAGREPLVVVLDEFQWLVRAQPALASIAQRHWDRWQRAGTRITLILSGSALTLMEQLVAHGSPLYGRANYRPLLGPLDYLDAAEFARAGSSAESLLRRYAVIGGTPQYQVWAGTGPLSAVISERILRKGESLYEEPLHLLRGEQQIRDAGTYFAILRAVSAGATQFNQIEQHAKIPRNLDVMLSRLNELGYVARRDAIEPKSGRPRGSYRIADPFFRFWFRYVFPNRSRLERGRAIEVLNEVEADLDTFMGIAFEDCCREWLGRYAPSDQYPSSERIGSYWSRDGQVEIDVVAQSKGRYDLLASCKWSRKAKPEVLDGLLDARDHLGGPASGAMLVIFARGFDTQLVRRAAETGVSLVPASHLFT